MTGEHPKTIWILMTIMSWWPVWFIGRIHGWREGVRDAEGTRHER